MEMFYRKGFANKADALSQRPELHHAIATVELRLLYKDLEDMHDCLSAMSYLEDESLLHKIHSR
jgi:hypothetical protein